MSQRQKLLVGNGVVLIAILAAVGLRLTVFDHGKTYHHAAGRSDLMGPGHIARLQKGAEIEHRDLSTIIHTQSHLLSLGALSPSQIVRLSQLQAITAAGTIAAAPINTYPHWRTLAGKRFFAGCTQTVAAATVGHGKTLLLYNSSATPVTLTTDGAPPLPLAKIAPRAWIVETWKRVGSRHIYAHGASCAAGTHATLLVKTS